MKQKRKSNPSNRAAPSLAAIADALGDIDVPDSLESFVQSLQQRWSNVLRFRREIDPQAYPIATDPVPWYKLARRSHQATPRPSRMLAYAAGDYYLQDAGSLLALAAGGVDTEDLRGKMICDLCAAPGGKASALVEAVGQGEGSGFVLANEPIRSRLPALQFNLARTGSDRYAVSQLDPDTLADRVGAVFDLVLVDAPCSGQALLGRGKQSRASLSQRQIVHSAARQQRILDAAIRLLKPGGQLVYSTCTFSRAENESQIERLLEYDAIEALPVAALAAYQSGTATYRLWPHRHECAGSFAGSIRVVDGDVQDEPVDERGHPRQIEESPELDLRRWYPENISTMRQHGGAAQLFALPDDAPAWLDRIDARGIELAYRTGQTWKPAHAGALLRGSNRPSHRIEIDAATARAYFRGEPFPCSETGWRVVTHAARPLGWIKSDGTTAKNHLPTAARTPVDPV